MSNWISWFTLGKTRGTKQAAVTTLLLAIFNLCTLFNLYTLTPTPSMRDWISWLALMKHWTKMRTNLSTMVLLVAIHPVISSNEKVDNIDPCLY